MDLSEAILALKECRNRIESALASLEDATELQARQSSSQVRPNAIGKRTSGLRESLKEDGKRLDADWPRHRGLYRGSSRVKKRDQK